MWPTTIWFTTTVREKGGIIAQDKKKRGGRYLSPFNPDAPIDISRKYLGKSEVQVNVRIPLRLRIRMDEFLDYMSEPSSKRSVESEDWPDSLASLVRTAIDEFLLSHPQNPRRQNKTGPRKPRTTQSIKPKSKEYDLYNDSEEYIEDLEKKEKK